MLSLVKPAGLILALAVIVFAGCNTGPRLNNVYGTLKYQGKPLPDAIVNFVPADGRPGKALTDEKGYYKDIQFGRDRYGLVAGDYDVVIKYLPPVPPASPLDPEPQPPPEFQPAFNKYGNFGKPEFKVTVKDGQGSLDIDLP